MVAANFSGKKGKKSNMSSRRSSIGKIPNQELRKTVAKSMKADQEQIEKETKQVKKSVILQSERRSIDSKRESGGRINEQRQNTNVSELTYEISTPGSATDRNHL